ncbi:MAG: SDR family oxidoreductase [Hyphomicrobiales bacterium]
MYMQKQRLDGNIALITGANRGIGRHTANALAEAGAHVILTGRDEEMLGQAAEELKSLGHKADIRALDVTSSEQTNEVAAWANKDIGNVDILIANAGIAWPSTNAEDMPDETWLKVIDVNLNGCFWSCRAFGKYMLERQKGSIVTVGSMSGFVSNKPQNQVQYNASKAAMHHMTKSLAGEWAERGVRVNAVAPTYVDTEMSNIAFLDPKNSVPWMEGTPMKRMIGAEEVASVNLFLASEAASGMTGSVLLVDAGYTIW